MHNLRENRIHGMPGFPFAVYPSNLEDNRKGYPLHWHEELELLYVVSGNGYVTVQGEHIPVEAGDMVLIAPQNVHGFDQKNGNEMTHYALLFRPSMLGTEYTDLLQGKSRALPRYLPKGTPLNSKLAPLLLELSHNRKRVNSDYSLMILSHLYAIAYHIIHENPELGEAVVDHNSNYDKLKIVLEFLQQNYSEEITVEQAASMCGFSQSHFMKLFRELTGSSFTQYVKNLRLEMAATQLRTTAKRISEVAEAVGFHNMPYFTRSFTEKYHLSPGMYRKG